MCPNDPDATKKLKECEKAVMKLKFEEAISAPESERRSIAESIDFHSIGTILYVATSIVSLLSLLCTPHLCSFLTFKFVILCVLLFHAIISVDFFFICMYTVELDIIY